MDIKIHLETLEKNKHKPGFSESYTYSFFFRRAGSATLVSNVQYVACLLNNICVDNDKDIFIGDLLKKHKDCSEYKKVSCDTRMWFEDMLKGEATHFVIDCQKHNITIYNQFECEGKIQRDLVYSYKLSHFVQSFYLFPEIILESEL